MNIWDTFSNWVSTISKGKKITTANFMLGTRTWAQYAPTFYGQKYSNYDTDDCWDFSGLKCIAYSCNFLMANGYFSQDAIDFFKTNGYLDSNGLFAFSERYISILSGVENNGNNQIRSGQLAEQFGLIPRSMLTYTDAQAQAEDYLTFCADYYNPKYITSDMFSLGTKFLTYVSIQPNEIGKSFITPDITYMKSLLQIAPLQVGVPVPSDTSLWNQATIQPWLGMIQANHSATMTDIITAGFIIDDQYQPRMKTLATGYLLSLVTQYIVTPIL